MLMQQPLAASWTFCSWQFREGISSLLTTANTHSVSVFQKLLDLFLVAGYWVLGLLFKGKAKEEACGFPFSLIPCKRGQLCPYGHPRHTVGSLVGTFRWSKGDIMSWLILTELLGQPEEEEEDASCEAFPDQSPEQGGGCNPPAPGPAGRPPTQSCSHRWALNCFKMCVWYSEISNSWLPDNCSCSLHHDCNHNKTLTC